MILHISVGLDTHLVMAQHNKRLVGVFKGVKWHMATITDVADYFRWRVDYESGDNITPLKLQKLCYYALAWHVVFTGKRFFEGEFEHWDHGPVNYSLYSMYKDYKWRPIDPNDIKETFSPADVFDVDELDTLQEVWETYGDYGAKHLETLTHQEDPWKMTKNNEVISLESMREYYVTMLNE